MWDIQQDRRADTRRHVYSLFMQLVQIKLKNLSILYNWKHHIFKEVKYKHYETIHWMWKSRDNGRYSMSSNLSVVGSNPSDVKFFEQYLYIVGNEM